MTFLELILLMYDTNYLAPYHPPPREQVFCIQMWCADERQLLIGCTEEFGALLCPELTPV
jgi:hypothetical protein